MPEIWGWVTRLLWGASEQPIPASCSNGVCFSECGRRAEHCKSNLGLSRLTGLGAGLMALPVTLDSGDKQSGSRGIYRQPQACLLKY